MPSAELAQAPAGSGLRGHGGRPDRPPTQGCSAIAFMRFPSKPHRVTIGAQSLFADSWRIYSLLGAWLRSAIGNVALRLDGLASVAGAAVGRWFGSVQLRCAMMLKRSLCEARDARKLHKN